MSARGPLITGTVLSAAVVSAWSWMASLTIGPALLFDTPWMRAIGTSCHTSWGSGVYSV